jgi:hypothetical protein
MNDIELDEMLNLWAAPEVPSSLRTRVRAGFGGQKKVHDRVAGWFSRRSLAGAVAVGMAILLVVVTRAQPQTATQAPPPYTVISEFVQYGVDGAAMVGIRITSYNDKDGREVILSSSLPGNPLGTEILHGLEAARRFANPLLLRLAGVSAAQLAAHRSIPGVTTGCANGNCMLGFGSISLSKAAANPAIGCVDELKADREVILGYSTSVVERPMGNLRIRVSMAPALGCFALKITTEERQADGTFRLVSGKRAVQVNLEN